MIEARCPACFHGLPGGGLCGACGFNPDDADDPRRLRPGTRLAGRYLVGGVLGGGGFGLTYRGYDTRLSSLVAIKEYFLSEGMSRAEDGRTLSIGADTTDTFHQGRTRFLEESRTLARLRPISRVVSVFDFFEENNTAYIVMDYLAGLTLAQLQRKYPDYRLPPQRAIPLFIDILLALHDIHQEKILHSDVSPDNIVICGNGAIKLIDFGAARQAAPRQIDTLAVLLKPGYAPIEQYAAATAAQGPWTDVYAAGATFYHALTGVRPPPSPERLARDELKPLSALGVTVGPGVAAAILKALALRPRDRWPDARGFAEALAVADPPGAVAAAPATAPLAEPRGPAAPAAGGFARPVLSAAELRPALAAHRRHVESRSRGQRLNLARHDLSCLRLGAVTLAGAELAGATFSCSDLMAADFRRANLFCADFSGANLRYVRFDGCDLRGATFDHADLTGSSLDGADCRDGRLMVQSAAGAGTVAADSGPGATSFHTVDLTGATLRRADLRQARFTESVLEDADFSGANLQAASLRGAHLARSRFAGAVLTACDFAGADLTGIDTTRPEFAAAIVPRPLEALPPALQQQFHDHAQWLVSLTRSGRRLVVRDGVLSGLQASGTDWSVAEFYSVAMAGIVLEWAALSRCRFVDCLLTDGRFADSDARGVWFQGCALERTDWSGADLTPVVTAAGQRLAATFRNCRLAGARFRRVHCPHADFRDSDLRGADFREAVLTDANVEGARLEGARFEGAVIERVSGWPAE